MNGGFTAGVLALYVPILVFPASCARGGDDPVERENQTRYPSPTAVFDAYREAQGKREWRKVFSLLTTEAQNDAIFESFFACAVHNSKEDREILKSYGIDEITLTEVLKDEYKAKHGDYPTDATLSEFIEKVYGADASKSDALQSDTKSEPAPAATKRELMIKILSAHIKDKPGFVEAAAKLSEEKSVSSLGDLEHVTIKGGTATGSARSTFLPKVEYGVAPSVYDKPFKFRQVNGSWLLDSL